MASSTAVTREANWIFCRFLILKFAVDFGSEKNRTGHEPIEFRSGLVSFDFLVLNALYT